MYHVYLKSGKKLRVRCRKLSMKVSAEGKPTLSSVAWEKHYVEYIDPMEVAAIVEVGLLATLRTSGAYLRSLFSQKVKCLQCGCRVEKQHAIHVATPALGTMGPFCPQHGKEMADRLAHLMQQPEEEGFLWPLK